MSKLMTPFSNSCRLKHFLLFNPQTKQFQFFSSDDAWQILESGARQQWRPGDLKGHQLGLVAWSGTLQLHSFWAGSVVSFGCCKPMLNRPSLSCSLERFTASFGVSDFLNFIAAHAGVLARVVECLETKLFFLLSRCCIAIFVDRPDIAF